MPLIEINDLASKGSFRDLEGYMLSPEAFTFADNVRFTNDGVERIGGRRQIFGTPPIAPHFALPIKTNTQTFWLYVSLTKGYVYDGTTHTNITRQTLGVDVDYTATDTRQWNGTLLGGVPILNNGADPPQYWAALSTGTKLAVLPNWPASTTAQVLRSFGPYLIALNVTKTGTNYPHMVKWSHPADPGTVPISWDATDPTKDAGENDLPDVLAGVILDGLPLQGRFYVYKEGSVWRMTQIGGQFIFSFDTFLETAGLLAPRCVCVTGDGSKHVFATQDDILIHNGSSAESVLDQKFKNFLINAIDTVNYKNSFMFSNPFYNEIWFCYPESGQTNPNRAIIWNWKRGSLSEAGVDFRNAAVGDIETPFADTWATIVGSWDQQFSPWSTIERRRVVACDANDTMFLELDQGADQPEGPITGTLQRVGLGVVGRKRNGEWIVDFAKQKMVTRIWIKATGGPLLVRVGFQERPDGPITWSTQKTFNTVTDKYVDIIGSGKAFGVEFTGSNPFRILGYKPEISVLGVY